MGPGPTRAKTTSKTWTADGGCPHINIAHPKQSGSFAEEEDHLLGGVVEGSFGEGAVFGYGIEACQEKQRAEVGVGVVAEAEGFGFFLDQFA
jgi:hypothetical protein